MFLDMIFRIYVIILIFLYYTSSIKKIRITIYMLKSKLNNYKIYKIIII